MNKLNFFFLRLPIALSLLGHGLVRIPKLSAFASGIATEMEKSIFPTELLTVMGYLIPIVELILGVLLVTGIKTRYTIYGGLALMSLLIIGSSSTESWGAVQAQLVHGIYLGFVLWWHETYVKVSNA